MNERRKDVGWSREGGQAGPGRMLNAYILQASERYRARVAAGTRQIVDHQRWNTNDVYSTNPRLLL